jgi:hypothetical protein
MKIKTVKKFLIVIFLITTAFKIDAQTDKIPRDATYYKSKGYQVFPEFGFAVKCLCTLGDISNQMKGDNDLSYGCVVNKDSQDKLIMYQILVKKVPEGYKHASAAKQKEFEDKISSFFTGDKKKVVFNNVNAIVVKYNHNNQFTGKAIIFIKNGATFTFNLMTNDGLEQKFNQLSNDIKFF